VGLSTHEYLYKSLTLYELFNSSLYGIGDVTCCIVCQKVHHTPLACVLDSTSNDKIV
jgi:hypothetical protein